MNKTYEKIQYIKNIEKVLDNVRKVETEIQLQAIRSHHMSDPFIFHDRVPFKSKIKRRKEKIKYSKDEIGYILNKSYPLKLKYSKTHESSGNCTQNHHPVSFKVIKRKRNTDNLILNKNERRSNIQLCSLKNLGIYPNIIKVHGSKKEVIATLVDSTKLNTNTTTNTPTIKIKIPKDQSICLNITSSSNTSKTLSSGDQKIMEKKKVHKSKKEKEKEKKDSGMNRQDNLSMASQKQIKTISVNLKTEDPLYKKLHQDYKIRRRQINERQAETFFRRRVSSTSILSSFGKTTSSLSTEIDQLRSRKEPIIQQALNISAISNLTTRRKNAETQTSSTEINYEEEVKMNSNKDKSLETTIDPKEEEHFKRLSGGSGATKDESMQTEQFNLNPISITNSKDLVQPKEEGGLRRSFGLHDVLKPNEFSNSSKLLFADILSTDSAEISFVEKETKVFSLEESDLSINRLSPNSVPPTVQNDETSTKNETDEMIKFNTCFTKDVEKRNEDTENDLTSSNPSDEESLELSPQEAIDQIKNGCWDSELLLLITPFDCETLDDAEQLQIHAIDKIYKDHLGSLCIPKSQLKILENSGLFKKYFIFIVSRKIDFDKELSPIIQHTRNISERRNHCQITNLPSFSTPNPLGILKIKGSPRKICCEELASLFKLSVENSFKIYAHPDYYHEDDIYIMEFFSERNNYLGTVSANQDAILQQMKANKEIIKNFKIILDVNELVMPNRLRTILSSVSFQLGILYIYDCLGQVLLSIFKKFA